MTEDVRDPMVTGDAGWRWRIEAARHGVLHHPAERGELFSPDELAASEQPDSGPNREDRRPV